MPRLIILGIIGIIIVGFGVFFATRGKGNSATVTTQTPSLTTTSVATSVVPTAQTKTIRSKDIAGISGKYNFSVTIPSTWEVEAAAAIDAINFYDPAANGSSNLEKSQIFMRNFEASSFLTLSTVSIHSRESKTINSRPAVVYDIEKKSGVANFANQPSWRNVRHFVTDIQTTDAKLTVYYVIAQKPGLSNDTYQLFLSSLEIK